MSRKIAHFISKNTQLNPSVQLNEIPEFTPTSYLMTNSLNSNMNYSKSLMRKLSTLSFFKFWNISLRNFLQFFGNRLRKD